MLAFVKFVMDLLFAIGTKIEKQLSVFHNEIFQLV